MEGFDKIKNKNLADWEKDQKAEAAVEETTPEVKETIDAPVGRNYVIDTEIEVPELRSFLMGHAYHQPTTWFIMILAIVFPSYYVFKNNANIGMAVIIAAVIFIIYPLTLIRKAKIIKNSNKTFQEIFHYMLDEVGFHLQLSDQAIDVEWKYFRKLMITKNAVVVYTGKSNGYIIPMKDMGDKKEEIIAFLQEKIKK